MKTPKKRPPRIVLLRARPTANGGSLTFFKFPEEPDKGGAPNGPSPHPPRKRE